jgi:cell shape-determining protein MreC
VTLPPDSASLSSAEKDVLIATPLLRLSALEAEIAVLRAENARLREKLDLPRRRLTS